MLIGFSQLGGVADLPHLRQAIAVNLFKQGALSVAAAATLAGEPLSAMLSRRAALEIPVVDYSADELRGAAMPRKITLSTPEEIRCVALLKPMGMSPYALAPAINMGRRRINEIVPGKGSIAADTALRLAAFFRTGDIARCTLPGSEPGNTRSASVSTMA